MEAVATPPPSLVGPCSRALQHIIPNTVTRMPRSVACRENYFSAIVHEHEVADRLRRTAWASSAPCHGPLATFRPVDSSGPPSHDVVGPNEGQLELLLRRRAASVPSARRSKEEAGGVLEPDDLPHAPRCCLPPGFGEGGSRHGRHLEIAEAFRSSALGHCTAELWAFSVARALAMLRH